jgi:hypothetical protein
MNKNQRLLHLIAWLLLPIGVSVIAFFGLRNSASNSAPPSLLTEVLVHEVVFTENAAGGILEFKINKPIEHSAVLARVSASVQGPFKAIGLIEGMGKYHFQVGELPLQVDLYDPITDSVIFKKTL